LWVSCFGKDPDALSVPPAGADTPDSFLRQSHALEEEMDFHDDPAEMSPSERLSEVAAILAAGYLRLRRHPQLAGPPETAESRLDSWGEPRPPLDTGARDPEEEEVAG
jgi:hypothetical protein